jgi:hypothetical protein
MSLLRPFLALGLVLAIGISVEGAQAGKKKKDTTGPVRGVITMIKANDANDGGTISVRIPDKKNQDNVVNYIVDKDTKIEGGTGKTAAARRISRWLSRRRKAPSASPAKYRLWPVPRARKTSRRAPERTQPVRYASASLPAGPAAVLQLHDGRFLGASILLLVALRWRHHGHDQLDD